MDKNQLTGLVLFGVLIAGYLYFAPGPDEIRQQQLAEKAKQDSIQAVQAAVSQPKPSPVAALPDSLLTQQFGPLGTAMKGQAQEVVLENSDVRIVLNAHGAHVRQVLLKNYVTYLKEPLVLVDSLSQQQQSLVQTRYGEVDLDRLYYAVENQSPTSVTFRTPGPAGIRRTYSLQSAGFVLGYDLRLEGLDDIVTDKAVRYRWLNRQRRVEKDVEQTRIRSTVNLYQTDGSLEYVSETETEKTEEAAETAIRWASLKQKFFNTAIITDAQFEQAKGITEVVDKEDPNYIKNTEVQFNIPVATLADGKANLRYYFGPNDYDICETVAPGFTENVYLGWAGFSTINLYLIVPLFKMLEGFTTNYGVIIFILVLIVKMIVFPLTYKSYMSMAKMKVMQPEVEEIKKKHPEDLMQQQSEMMNLYNSVGVSPMSGCIPMLLQVPIFMSMFNFFPNAIQLRQQGFLWADDLSTYDSILQLPFYIPMYGDHVSLFTILMTISTLIYTYYNNQITTAANQQMVVISYIMPVTFMLFLNSFSSGLTYYYFVSNIITIAQQLSIRRFVDDKKIRAILEKNRKKLESKENTGGGFQKRLADALKAQQEATKANRDKKDKK